MGMDWMWEDQIQLCLSESGPGMQGAGWGLNESRVSEDDQEKTVTVWGLGLFILGPTEWGSSPFMGTFKQVVLLLRKRGKAV